MTRPFARSSILCASLLPWSSAWAQSPRAAEQAPLIESIQGPALFKAYCASCHGADGRGAGPMAKSLKVPPADLTRISMRNGGKFPLVRIEGIIAGEEQLPGGHGSREMPVWGPIFSHVERDQDRGRVRIDNLARYLRDIQR